MSNNLQPLGGTRQSSPLDDEMTYPLTKDEYLVIKDNLSIERLSNWESILISTGITTLISTIILACNGHFEKISIENNISKTQINWSEVITIMIYGAFSIGSIAGFIISIFNKKKAKNIMIRLDEKIMRHLNK